MKLVYVLCHEDGAYSDYTHEVCGVFSTPERAEAELLSVEARWQRSARRSYLVEVWPLDGEWVTTVSCEDPGWVSEVPR